MSEAKPIIPKPIVLVAAVALIDARRLDHYHQLERSHIHLLLLEDAARGLADVEAGRSVPAAEALAAIKLRRGAT